MAGNPKFSSLFYDETQEQTFEEFFHTGRSGLSLQKSVEDDLHIHDPILWTARDGFIEQVALKAFWLVPSFGVGVIGGALLWACYVMTYKLLHKVVRAWICTANKEPKESSEASADNVEQKLSSEASVDTTGPKEKRPPTKESSPTSVKESEL